MSEIFPSIEHLAGNIKNKLDTATTKKKILALYAFNATGKTRLTSKLIEREEDDEIIKSLCYNAFLEDMFVWDNEEYILKFNPNDWVIKFVRGQELENQIIDNFKDITNSNGLKLEPSFNFTAGEVTFKIVSGDDASASNIKISKGEESMLIWSVFYSVLQTAIEALNTNEEDRTTAIFNDLQYIIIDDPVSSIDDTKIIAMAIKLIEAIKEYQGNTVKFLITTHHALFYNVLINSFERLRKKDKCEFESYTLTKKPQEFELKRQDDSPFSYHLSVKKTIQNAIDTNSIEKYHFNLFRNLLEKTAIFLGYNAWSDCIKEDENKEGLKHRLQVYSHSKGSDLESIELSNEDKTLLQETFTSFITDFKWK